jgi:iron-sulfur cluster repair protein YtfE (RIC family)
MSDAMTELAHDHAALNRMVLSLASAVRRGGVDVSSGHLELGLGELRDELFHHFAREEEALFPFVADVMPALEPQVKTMLAAHDMICGSLSRMVHLAATDAPTATLLALFERFENAYAEHAQMETALLSSLDASLDRGQRNRLSDLVASL